MISSSATVSPASVAIRSRAYSRSTPAKRSAGMFGLPAGTSSFFPPQPSCSRDSESAATSASENLEGAVVMEESPRRGGGSLAVPQGPQNGVGALTAPGAHHNLTGDPPAGGRAL